MNRETSDDDTYRWNWHSYWIQILNSMIAFERRNLWKCESQPVGCCLLLRLTQFFIHKQHTFASFDIAIIAIRDSRLSSLPHWMVLPFLSIMRTMHGMLRLARHSICTETLHKWNEKKNVKRAKWNNDEAVIFHRNEKSIVDYLTQCRRVTTEVQSSDFVILFGGSSKVADFDCTFYVVSLIVYFICKLANSITFFEVKFSLELWFILLVSWLLKIQ